MCGVQLQGFHVSSPSHSGQLGHSESCIVPTYLEWNTEPVLIIRGPVSTIKVALCA